MSTEYAWQEQPPKVRLDHNVVGPRIVAAIIDVVLLTIASLLVVAFTGGFEKNSDGMYEMQWSPGMVGLLFVITYGYYIAFEGLVGATFGKMLMGLQVVDLEGQPCGMGKAAVRNLVRIVDSFFFWIPGLVCIFVTPTHQRIGDLAAGTLVVKG